MTNIEKFKDVEIDGDTYRIGRLSAFVGNWMVTQLLAKTYSQEETFKSVQAHCLDVCMVYREHEKDGSRTPIKVFEKTAGRFLVSGLENDLFTVNRLVEEVIAFNLNPFFEKLGIGKQDGTQDTP